MGIITNREIVVDIGRRITNKERVVAKREIFMFLENYVFLSIGLPSMKKGKIVE
jgi:hypothetical protein